ncbi:phosphatase PAP2 family protein [Nonlabens sp. Ci31]|jgi:undecaprenyl-diphosphatase|uniref:phosphatase PAP2 family protein n=1 Tax=Nonlabens sp. Ci31 TaxID=2608253 RepID=UPI0014639382|nr:phosphatase PAP2 family protein [Nonlabens sp. Ci31]QJP33387.1 phosphatase PAP2 family protein [Nonlabens sp. Ci31]
MLESLVEIDQDILRWVNGFWIGKFQFFWLFVTRIENWLLLYLFFFYLLFRKFQKPVNYIALLMLPLLVFVTLSLTNLVKNTVERLRPYNDPLLRDSIQVLQEPESFSFWSGHSAVSFAVTTFIILALRTKAMTKWVLLFYLWPVIFALSRVFIGVHYPGDIVVGMLVGFLLGWGCFMLFSKIEKRLQHSA